VSDDAGGKRLTRRRILAGVAGAAGIGLVGGAGTRAFLRDTEVVPGSALGNPYQGNHLDLNLYCPNSDGACTAEVDSVSFAFEGVDPPTSGATTFCSGLSGGPAWLWLKTVPSTVSSPLGEELQVTLAYVDGDSRTPVKDPEGADVEDRTLNGLLAAFDTGGMIPGVVGPEGAFGETEERCLELSWSLPERDPVLSKESVEFTLRFAAVQYRAEVDADTSNPWGQS
jgi:hypothetical protein